MDKIQELKTIIQSKEGKTIDDFWVDFQTAYGLIHFYNKLDNDGKERFSILTIPIMVDIVIEDSKNQI